MKATASAAVLALVIGVAVALALLPSLAVADNKPPTTVSPGWATTKNGNVSGTVAATGVFQQVFPATSAASPRNGCTIQNNSAHTMYVSEGLGIAGSTTANSAQLAAGMVYYCQSGVVALQGEVDVTGTTGDVFYASQY